MGEGKKQYTLGAWDGSDSKTPGKGLEGDFCNGDLESTGGIQNFTKGPEPVGVQEAGSWVCHHGA